MLALMAALALAAVPDAALLDEARGVMDGYARDLLADDRAAIVARYCDAGARTLDRADRVRVARSAI